MKKVKITIQTTEALRARLNKKARKEKISVAHLLNDFIKSYVRK